MVYVLGSSIPDIVFLFHIKTWLKSKIIFVCMWGSGKAARRLPTCLLAFNGEKKCSKGGTQEFLPPSSWKSREARMSCPSSTRIVGFLGLDG